MKINTFSFILIVISLMLVRADEKVDGPKDFTNFCSFDLPLLNHTIAEDEDFCNCDVTSSILGHNIVGRKVVKIDCALSDRVNLTNDNFHAGKLPINTVSLLLSFQQFTEIPDFISPTLLELSLSYNQITIVKELNFIHVTSLERLDLSNNNISDIKSNAFALLQFLHNLDLSGNRLTVLPANVFSVLVSLETLNLSGNDGFGMFFQNDTTSMDIYRNLGVQLRLKELVIERCNLTRINLMHGIGLETLKLGHNNISDFSMCTFPNNLEKLDLSANPIRDFTAKSLPHLYNLVELILEDLPFLGIIQEYSLYGFPRLSTLTLEGSKNLSKIDGSAFGINVVTNETDLELKVLNLRGCNLRTLNDSLLLVLDHLVELNLDGNPINCNCDIEWLKEMELETNLRCSRPDELFGRLLSQIDDKELHCSKMGIFLKNLVNALILIVLLMGCSIMVWCFFQQISPSRRSHFQKVSPDSPYQRVTIEPNRAEYSLY